MKKEYEIKGIAKDLIIKHEDLSLVPYYCTAGKLTIGYGRNIEDRGITKEESLKLLENDIIVFFRELYSVISNFEDLPPKCAAALLDMIYALGLPRFSKFKDMIRSIERDDFETAADDMLNSLWYQKTPNRPKELSEIIRKCAL